MRRDEELMISECANPKCSTPFRYLTRGSSLKSREHREQGSRKVEWYWLCERCAGRLAMVFRPNGTVELKKALSTLAFALLAVANQFGLTPELLM